MALPKLNNANYELTLPSTGKQLRYRPFLVKEQKALMIAQESEDDKLIENTFAQAVFEMLSGTAKALYSERSGNYQNQKGVTWSK